MTTTVIVRFIDRSLAHIGFNVVYYVKLSGWDKTLMVSLLELLRDGYFPRELPPPFTSQSFATTIVSSGSALPNSIMNGELRNNRRWAMAAPYHISRIGKLQRRLSIPNPITQARLSKEIADNWAVLQAFTSQSQLSLSTPKAGTNRAIIPENSWGVIPGIRAVKQIGERFLVKTDINNFYHSIYTHSLPWALHTKSVAKVNRGHNYLGNLLDSLIQMGQEGQTSGIPIGPDTSFMLAELLLTAIDAELIGKLGPLNGFRYVDDYELCFPTMSEAEKALHQLELILGEFELSLNPTKTGIHDTPFILQDNWATELNRFEIRDKPVSQRNDLIGYFSRVGELSKVFEDQSVYRFAIARFRTLKVDASNVNLLQNLLLHCISSEQGTAPFALEILVILNKSGYPPPQSQLKRVFDSQILYHGAQGHTSEVAWPLWGAIIFGVPLSLETAKVVSSIDNSIIALLALDADSRGLFPPNSLDKTRWELHMTTDSLYEDAWLLSYEANIKGWLPSPSGVDHVAQDANFNFLKSQGVQFYDMANTSPVIPGATQPFAGPTGGLSPVAFK